MRNLACVLAVLAFAGCGDKNKADEAPPEGWYSEADWPGQCFFPKNYEALGHGDRKIARSEALQEIVPQWRGERDDGVKFSPKMVEYFETVMLGEPDLIEAVTQRNAAECKAYMSADPETRSISKWKNYVEEEPERLTEGDCPTAPLVDTVFQYLEIDTDWQFQWNVCAEDVVTITGTQVDRYKITKDGEYIDVNGTEENAISTDYPCNMEGCKVGMLIMRFTGESGVQTVYPVGAALENWKAPEHGRIEVMINDTSWTDNEFRQQGSLIDHTSITYKGGGS